MLQITWAFLEKPISKETVEYIEKEINLSLSRDYVECVLEYNGGSPDPCTLHIGKDVYVVNKLYSLNQEDSLNVLELYYLIMNDNRTDEGILFPFADDPGGNDFCFIYKNKKDTNPKIVFRDHETGKIKYIAESFSDFLGMLKPC
jgi:hypothetical protein